MLTVVESNAGRAYAAVTPARRAILSWCTGAPAATIDLIVHTADGRRSRSLPYVAFEPRANVTLDRIAVSVAANGPRIVRAPFRGELVVPELAQHAHDVPESYGWCTPACIAMLVASYSVRRTVAEVAAGTYDRAYRGTGNWAFAVAYASQCGFFGAVAYLRDLRSIDAFLDAGLPLAVSIAWDRDLPNAPLTSSKGHLVVMRGRTADGDVIVNDPAHAHVRHVYPAAAFERAWLGHGGVALLVAPRNRIADCIRCANE